MVPHESVAAHGHVPRHGWRPLVHDWGSDIGSEEKHCH